MSPCSPRWLARSVTAGASTQAYYVECCFCCFVREDSAETICMNCRRRMERDMAKEKRDAWERDVEKMRQVLAAQGCFCVWIWHTCIGYPWCCFYTCVCRVPTSAFICVFLHRGIANFNEQFCLFLLSRSCIFKLCRLRRNKRLFIFFLFVVAITIAEYAYDSWNTDLLICLTSCVNVIYYTSSLRVRRFSAVSFADFRILCSVEVCCRGPC